MDPRSPIIPLETKPRDHEQWAPNSHFDHELESRAIVPDGQSFSHPANSLAEGLKYPLLILQGSPTPLLYFELVFIVSQPSVLKTKMPGILRLSATVTLRLDCKPDVSASSLRIKIKPKASRPALAGITNATEADPLFGWSEDTCDASAKSPSSKHTQSSPPHPIRVIKSLPRRCSPGPFYRLGCVGTGTFGDAIAVRDLRFLGGGRGRTLCLKVFDKAKTKKNGTEWVIIQELHAFQTLTAVAGDKWLPFVIRMEASMEDTESIIFALELMEYDLLTVMQDWEQEKVVKHKNRWIAEIAAGITAIHSAGIIHRDIKPENILIDFATNVRITDFGCSYVAYPTGNPLKPTIAYCSEITGTLPYHAPEMIANQGIPRKTRTEYGIAIDYWGLGCVAYELETCGDVREEEETIEPLFKNRTALNAYVNHANTLGAETRYEQFKGLSNDAYDLIFGLLCPNPSLRYGDHQLRCHAYFNNNDTGRSEFIGIEARGLALNTLLDKKDVPEHILHMQDSTTAKPIYCPLAYAPRGAPIGYDLSNIGWINPKGIWGPLHNDPAFYTTRPR